MILPPCWRKRRRGRRKKRKRLSSAQISSRLRLIGKKARPKVKRCKKTLEKSGGRIFTSLSESLSKIFPPISFNFLPFEITNAGEVLSFKLGFLINAGRWICSLILSVQLYRRRRQTSSSPFFSSLDARNSRNAPPLSIVVSSVGERMGTALLFPCYAERLVFVFRFVVRFSRGTRGEREASDPVRSMCFPGGGRDTYRGDYRYCTNVPLYQPVA